jgi:DMSO/TMAO reductase YedYZ molybdopterin-dependent catalytic subunit
MTRKTMSRRAFLARGGTALAGLALFNSNWAAHALALQPDEEVIPWLDRRAENPVPEVIANQPTWEELDAWITPNEKFFSIAHYNRPMLGSEGWQLEITGLVEQPLALTLDEIMSRPRQELGFTLECSGNNGLPFFNAGIGNAQWAGVSLALLLEEAKIMEDGIEVVFFGTDAGEETVRDQTIVENFARSMSLEDAMHPDNILCYEMNGEPLPQANGYPLRLIAPGWYGIANVKWLDRIEIWGTRLENRFMARDYVTLRQVGTEDNPLWLESSVGRARLKSAPGRVVRSGDSYRIDGAAWGAPIASVEVQIDGGDWQPTQLGQGLDTEYTWVFWSLDWAMPESGEHMVTSRAIDTDGNVQPTQDDPFLANKITYWESNGQITRQVAIP